MRFPYILIVLFISLGCKRNAVIKPVGENKLDSSEFKKGEAFFNSNKNKDSAFYYFTNVTETSKDSLLTARAYSYMAMIQADAGDYFGSQESALEGLKRLDEKKPEHYRCLSSIYNELGFSSTELKHYKAAIEYYDHAIEFQQNDSYKIIFLNNKAVTYRGSKDYPKAIKILDSLVIVQRGNKLSYARALTNLASTKWLADSNYYPVPDFTKALNIRIGEKNDLNIASSYNHLSDYYLKHNQDSALFYARNMYRLAQIVNSSEQKIDALKKLIALAPANESKLFFRQYQHLNDSIVNARNEAKNQFALIKYQSEKNKEENLLLQKDNSEKELQILRQRIGIYGVVVLLAVILLIAFWWLNKKRQQIQWESETAIRENNLRTSQKVHDTVANGLYSLMKEIEYKDIDKEELLDKVDHLYERSRDISYEPVEHRIDPAKNINDLLKSFGTPQTSVLLTGDQEEIWNAVTPTVAKEIEQVLQELMINMAKHSGAQHVVIRFGHEHNNWVISYRDDGIGFAPGFKYGNGLKSTETRIGRIGGQLIFVPESTPGASIKIVIPISNT